MSKKSARKKPRKTSGSPRLPPLTGIQQQVMAYVLNNVAFDNYRDCCSIEGIAAQFQRTPGRFMGTLRKLVDKGYLTIRGEILPWVYPTSQRRRATHNRAFVRRESVA